MMKRSTKLKARKKWNDEWKTLQREGKVKSFDEMLDMLIPVLKNNDLEPGAHWCFICQNGNRGQLCQVTGEVDANGRIEIEGKVFCKVNTMTVVHPLEISLPVYSEVDA